MHGLNIIQLKSNVHGSAISVNLSCMYVAIGECSMPKLDVIFVIDTSKSMGGEKNFGVIEKFMKNITNLLKINSKDSLIALISFAANVSIQLSLTDDTKSFHQAVNNTCKQGTIDKGTNTPAVLNLLKDAGKNGSLGLRNDTIKVVFMITDGRPNGNNATKNTRTAATNLHKSGIYDRIYGIGIEANKPIGKALNYISYPPSLIFPLPGFDETLFHSVTQSFLVTFCNGEF